MDAYRKQKRARLWTQSSNAHNRGSQDALPLGYGAPRIQYPV